MSRLAVLGGEPVFEAPLNRASIWPPRDERTAKKLSELYMSGDWTAFGPVEPEFAQAFADFHGASHGAFMVNGTVTLQCGLGAYGIGPGDEVIVPSLTWYATAMAAVYLGATPVFVDIDPQTLCIDPDRIEAAITSRTKAIIPVHLFGSMADMDRIMSIARRHGLRVIEDCAHAHGGIWDGKGIGSIGDVGSFSFQDSKTMASAEGGICITSDPEAFDRIFRMKQIGYGPGQVPNLATSGPPPGLICYPFRATAFQSLILRDQLDGLSKRLEKYQTAVNYLEGRLGRTTKLRFQQRGLKADRQSFFCWAAIFDDPAYDDISPSSVFRAFQAEGLPFYKAWSPVYRFILFNLPSDRYRVEHSAATERLDSRIFCLSHAFLSLDEAELERICDAVEKVLDCPDQLRALDPA